jgi:putative ABC transport system permease protein
MAVFTVGALSICMGGVFAMVRFAIATRGRDLAIRLALGSSRRRVVLQAAGETLTAATLGSAVGMLVGHWTSSTLRSLSYGLSVGGWLTSFYATAAVVVVLALVAVCAARQAASIAPHMALRSA